MRKNKPFLLLLILQQILFLSCNSKLNSIDSKLIINFESPTFTDSITSSFSGVLSESDFFDGKRSAAFEEKNQSLKFNLDLNPKSIYKASFWKKGDVRIYVKISNDNYSVTLKEDLSYRSEKGWDKIELIINTSFWEKKVRASVIIEHIGDVKAFIDNVKVEKIICTKTDFSLKIKNKNVKKLVEFRNNAANSAYIKSDFKQKINADLDGKEVKFKLKGDWTDHVNTGIWSFKTYGHNPIYKDLKTLTFQNVKTRNLLKEFTFINLCKVAGIVTPVYEIVNVSVNGGTPYVCALEENFSDDFIYRKRGYRTPVLRLFEDFLFPHWVYGWGHKDIIIPEINHSYIYCFDTEKYRKGASKKEFDSAALKLKQFIKEDSIIHLVDQEKWATFLAIQAITKSYHNLTWHNTRWFVNKKGLIEPIAYDGNTQNGETENWFGGLYGDLNRYMKNGPSVAINFNNKLFMNPGFMKIYKEKLLLYSNESFLRNELDLIGNDVDLALNKIKAFYDYNYSEDYLFVSAEKLRREIKNIDNSDWFGKENIFNIDFKTGNAPLNKTYAKNLVRGYYKDGKILILNGTSEEIQIFTENKKHVHKIKANSEFTTKSIAKDKWFLKIESDLIRLPIIPWMPLN